MSVLSRAASCECASGPDNKIVGATQRFMRKRNGSIPGATGPSDQVEQRQQRLQSRGDVRPGGRIQHAVDVHHLVLIGDAERHQLGLRPIAGVEFHRQVHDLEEYHRGK